MEPRHYKVEKNRRTFIKESAALGMAWMAAGSLEAQEAQSTLLPTIDLGPHKVTRLIVGSNPMLGYSHFNSLLSRMMKEYYSNEKIAEHLFECQKQGINTFQSSYDDKLAAALRYYRDKGGDIHWVCLANGEQITKDDVLKKIIDEHKPIAVAHHGWVTDRLHREGQLDKANDFVKRVQDKGVLAGLSTHNPEILKVLEDKGWSNDFYMASFHYISRSEQELKDRLGHVPVPRNEVYLEDDPSAMCEAVRRVGKPTLVYKILAAGRYCNNANDVENRFKFAYESIKKTDAVIVGMFPLYEDQVALNTGYAKKYA